MTTFNPDRNQLIDTHKDVGTRQRGLSPQPSRQVRKPDDANTPAGPPSATSATPPAAHDDRNYAQPFERHHLQEAQVVQLRLQRPAGQLPGAARRAARRRRQSPGPRDRHRNHHARDQPRAVGRPPAARWSTCCATLPATIRRGLQHRVPQRPGRHGRGPRSAGHPAAVLRDRRAAVRRGQRKRGAAESRASRRKHQVAAAGARDHRSATASSRSQHVRRQPAARPLLLRVDLLRQRRQHARRPQRLSVAQGAGRGTGAAGNGADRRRHDRRARARHEQGRGRRDGLRAGRARASKA